MQLFICEKSDVKHILVSYAIQENWLKNRTSSGPRIWWISTNICLCLCELSDASCLSYFISTYVCSCVINGKKDRRQFPLGAKLSAEHHSLKVMSFPLWWLVLYKRKKKKTKNRQHKLHSGKKKLNEPRECLFKGLRSKVPVGKKNKC